MKTCTLLCVALLAACSSSANNNGDDDGSADAGHHADSHQAVDAPEQIDAPHHGSNGSGSFDAIPLTTPDDSFWSPTVTVGGQNFVMDIDTGSTTLGVAGASCSSCSVSPKYTPGSGATDQHQTADTTYEDNSGWSGEVYKDTVTLGNGSPTVTMAFADITTQDQFFYDGNAYQGIIGLGPTVLADPHTDSYFDTIVGAGENALMAFELCDDGGTMWLGGFDATHTSADPQYTPMLAINDNQPWYALTISGMSLGSTSISTGVMFDDPIVDTGTTLFYVPTTVYTRTKTTLTSSTAFKNLFGSTAKFDQNDCVTKAGVTSSMVDAALPTLTMSLPGVGGGTVNVTTNASQTYLYDFGSGQFCLGMADGGGNETTIGDAYMRAFVTVIDEANNQIGWAPSSGCGSQFHAHVARAQFHPHPPKPRRPHH